MPHCLPSPASEQRSSRVAEGSEGTVPGNQPQPSRTLREDATGLKQLIQAGGWPGALERPQGEFQSQVRLADSGWSSTGRAGTGKPQEENHAKQ